MSTGKTLKELANAKRGALVPGAFNALSARVIADLGFEAIYITGAGVTNMHIGLPDMGFMGLAEIAEQTGRIRDAVDVPLLVDADTGFGNALNVRHTIRTLERAGADCVQLEDQVSPKRCGHFNGKAVIGADEMISKIKAAVDARRSESADEVRRLPRFVRAPLLMNMVIGGKTPIASADELAQFGYGIVLYANAALQGALAGMQRALTVLRDQRHLDEDPALVAPFSERQRLVGKELIDELEQRYKN